MQVALPAWLQPAMAVTEGDPYAVKGRRRARFWLSHDRMTRVLHNPFFQLFYRGGAVGKFDWIVEATVCLSTLHTYTGSTVRLIARRQRIVGHLFTYMRQSLALLSACLLLA